MGPTEFRLLHFLITHAERVYSRGQMLDQVWGDHVFVEERTVDVLIRRLRNDLSPAVLYYVIQTARGAGYCFCTTHSQLANNSLPSRSGRWAAGCWAPGWGPPPAGPSSPWACC